MPNCQTVPGVPRLSSALPIPFSKTTHRSLVWCHGARAQDQREGHEDGRGHVAKKLRIDVLHSGSGLERSTRVRPQEKHGERQRFQQRSRRFPRRRSTANREPVQMLLRFASEPVQQPSESSTDQPLAYSCMTVVVVVGHFFREISERSTLHAPPAFTSGAGHPPAGPPSSRRKYTPAIRTAWNPQTHLVGIWKRVEPCRNLSSQVSMWSIWWGRVSVF